MNCPKCGNAAAPGAAFCAICGSNFAGGMVPGPGVPPPMPAYGYQQPMMMGPQRTSGMAIAGFILSLVVCGILGLIFSIMGHNEVKRSNGMVGGGGLAMAGIIISIIRLVLEVIYILVIIAAIGSNSHHYSSY
jgi:hypothetical protein